MNSLTIGNTPKFSFQVQKHDFEQALQIVPPEQIPPNATFNDFFLHKAVAKFYLDQLIEKRGTDFPELTPEQKKSELARLERLLEFDIKRIEKADMPKLAAYIDAAYKEYRTYLGKSCFSPPLHRDCAFD